MKFFIIPFHFLFIYYTIISVHMFYVGKWWMHACSEEVLLAQKCPPSDVEQNMTILKL